MLIITILKFSLKVDKFSENFIEKKNVLAYISIIVTHIPTLKSTKLPTHSLLYIVIKAYYYNFILSRIYLYHIYIYMIICRTRRRRRTFRSGCGDDDDLAVSERTLCTLCTYLHTIPAYTYMQACAMTSSARSTHSCII